MIHLTTLGLIHTIIGVLALIPAFVSLFTFGVIAPQKRTGKIYIILTALACLTSFPIMKSGHLSPGHFLAITILVMLPLAYYAPSIKLFGQKWQYIQVTLMSLTLFFSLVPAFTETLIRVPLGHPFASGQEDPALQPVMGVLALVFVVGICYQLYKLRGQNKKLQSA
ncbi:hypothetical protein [Chitinophaga sp. CF418]|uniref:hypothetical protein n=1 Tax=Chitinophaga sp. CF418 TaxID=1855287 RepID=UPI00122C98D5|nr:hypothetical protein [Chitinophaga sp. CF418]